MKKLKNKKGFTLMEMLIVVAIIAVLIAITIPTVNVSMSKVKMTADAANIRAYCAQVQLSILLEENYTVIADKAAAKESEELKLQAEENLTRWEIVDGTLHVVYGDVLELTIENYQKTT